jgi:hypothetical protein
VSAVAGGVIGVLVVAVAALAAALFFSRRKTAARKRGTVLRSIPRGSSMTVIEAPTFAFSGAQAAPPAPAAPAASAAASGVAAAAGAPALPDGWTEAMSKSRGLPYFRHTDGQTTWTRPE